MNRHGKSALALLGAVLLAGSLAAGCARHGGNETSGSGTYQPTSAVPSVVVVALDNTPSQEPLATQASSPGATQATTQSAQPPQPTPISRTTPDPLDSELQGVNQLLNGIDTSLSGSDSGTSGGE